MKIFLKKMVQFIIPILLLYFGSICLFKILVNKTCDFCLPKNVTSVILGHSQPEAALNDSLIPNTKNLCNGGEAYLYTYKKLQIVLKHNPQIKKVYVSFSNNQIEAKMATWLFDDTHMEQYFAKYNFQMEREDYKLALQNNFTELIQAESKAIILNAKRLIKRKNAFNNNELGGYLYLKRFKVDSLLKTNFSIDFKKKQSNKISQNNINYLKKIVKYCYDKKVKLYFIRTPIHPEFFSILDEKQFQKIRKQDFSTIPFLDFHDFKLTNDEFGDFDHLNYKGAKKFSVYFNSEMQKSLH